MLGKDRKRWVQDIHLGSDRMLAWNLHFQRVQIPDRDASLAGSDNAEFQLVHVTSTPVDFLYPGRQVIGNERKMGRGNRIEPCRTYLAILSCGIMLCCLLFLFLPDSTGGPMGIHLFPCACVFCFDGISMKNGGFYNGILCAG
ncbi:hypothetical protein DFP94_12112 [Fontibacillus phaseoli]|uniref:Uncharacterized protein n=1 Tax=Fontibacillus phaseoli TaxID=1416533 RepID=A0A369AY86_9BACL|nr:hypothetical protein DFP94_12112 [Fontibacillus phaseoli]